MKLFYSAGSCSTSCHITLEESGLRYEAVGVDWDNEKDPSIPEVERLNPLGTLPILVLDSGKTLDQNAAIHVHVADQVPGKLLPAVGTEARAEALNWLAFVTSDLHKAFSPLFAVKGFSPDEKARARFREWSVGNVNKYLAYLNQRLEGKDYLTGKNFTVADAYCFVVTSWTKWLDVPLEPYPVLRAYLERVYQRPAVQRVMKAEGLLD